jgi:ribbon-helix-helix protein, copG family|nr:MAG TPA: antitoxin [Caudoviricetes sp.]
MKNTTIQIRVDEETKKMIEEKAKQENRSVSNYLINLALKDINKNK